MISARTSLRKPFPGESKPSIVTRTGDRRRLGRSRGFDFSPCLSMTLIFLEEVSRSHLAWCFQWCDYLCPLLLPVSGVNPGDVVLGRTLLIEVEGVRPVPLALRCRVRFSADCCFSLYSQHVVCAPFGGLLVVYLLKCRPTAP